MSKKVMKTLATSAALIAASTTTTAFAEEVDTKATQTEPVVAETVTEKEAEVAVPEKKVTSEDIKPTLDAQKAVVSELEEEAKAAQTVADEANAVVSKVTEEAKQAEQAVKDAEADVANATPENIAANQAEQAANLADQSENAADTEEVNAEIAAQTEKVTAAQTAVDTAQSEKNTADQVVADKEADFKLAEDALNGTGVNEAQRNLENANAKVDEAKTAVQDATNALEVAKDTDTNRELKIKAAQDDVTAKNAIVTEAKAALTKATADVTATTTALEQANEAVTQAQDALENVDIVSSGGIPTRTYENGILDGMGFSSNTITLKDAYDAWRENSDSDKHKRLLRSLAVITDKAFETNTSLAKDDTPVNLNDLTNQQIIEISQLYADYVNELRIIFGRGEEKSYVSQLAVDIVKERADKYEQRGTDPRTDGHLSGVDNLVPLGNGSDIKTMTDLKNVVKRAFELTSFEDYPSNWQHLNVNLYASGDMAIDIFNINGEYWMTILMGGSSNQPIPSSNDTATLKANLTQAQAEQQAAKTASDEAKAQLAKASTDYATALELKTAAEKTLAGLQSTPSQVKVAENNLRLAEIALQNTKARAAEAQETVNNFLVSTKEKQVRYIQTRGAYTQVKYDQEVKAEALTAAQTKLAEEQAKLDALNQEKATLLAEKDRLVQEAKDLADELDRYTNADASLANAKEKQAEISAKLTEAQEKAAEAHKALNAVNTKLAEEKAKLDKLQAEYDTLKAAEDAQNHQSQTTEPKQGSQTQSPNTISLTNGTKVTLPSDTKGDVKSTTSSNTIVTPVNQSTVSTIENRTTTITKPQAGVTITTTAQEQKVTYSRVERAKTLPSTGERETVLSLLGISMLSSLGIVKARRKRYATSRV